MSKTHPSPSAVFSKIWFNSILSDLGVSEAQGSWLYSASNSHMFTTSEEIIETKAITLKIPEVIFIA